MCVYVCVCMFELYTLQFFFNPTRLKLIEFTDFMFFARAWALHCYWYRNKLPFHTQASLGSIFDSWHRKCGNYLAPTIVYIHFEIKAGEGGMKKYFLWNHIELTLDTKNFLALGSVKGKKDFLITLVEVFKALNTCWYIKCCFESILKRCFNPLSFIHNVLLSYTLGVIFFAYLILLCVASSKSEN